MVEARLNETQRMFGLATYAIETPIGRFTRLGALLADDTMVDLRAAYAAHLAEREGDPQAARVAMAGEGSVESRAAGGRALFWRGLERAGR